MTKEENNVAQGTESNASESTASQPKSKETAVTTEKAEKTEKPTSVARSSSSPNVAKETVKSRKQQSTSVAAPPVPKSSGKTLTWIMLLLNLAFISAATYAGYIGWQHWSNFKAEQTALQQQIHSNLQNQINTQLQSSAQAQEKVLSNQFDAANNVLQEQNQRIEEIYDMAQRLSGAQAGQWQISEALFIVRMAGRKLWLEKDPVTAIMLLQQADQQLAAIPESRLITVRQNLAGDIAALEAVNYTTPTQKVLQLQGLYAQVESLSIMQPSDLLMEQTSTDSPAVELTAMQKFKHWFKDNIFDITRVDQPVSPFIGKKQQWLAREQLKYLLLVAQNALFQEQADIYSSSLAQSQNLLSQYFDMENSLSKSFTDKLSQLATHEFGSPYPERLSAESALNALINGNNQPAPNISDTQNSGDSLL